MRKIALIIITMVAILSLQSCSDVAFIGSTDYLYTDYYVYSRVYPYYYHRPVPPPPHRRDIVRPHKPQPKPHVGLSRHSGNRSDNNHNQGRPSGNRGSFGGRR